MNLPLASRIVVCGALLLAGNSSQALAQIAPPSRGSSNAVFGRPSGRTSTEPRIDLQGSLYGGYDDDIAAALSGRPGTSRPTNSQGGVMTGGSTSLTFSRPGQRGSFATSVRAGINQFPKANTTATNYGASAVFDRQVSRRTSLGLTGRFEYAPYYGLGTRLFANQSDIGLPGLDDGLQDFDQISADAYLQQYQARFNREVSNRSSITASYRFRNTDFGTVSRDLTVHDGAVTFNHDLARYMTLRLGYGYTQSLHQTTSQDDNRYGFHRIIASVDYNRSFSISMTKRTQASFGFGSSVGQQTRFEGDVTGREPGTDPRLYVTGNAQLSHDMARTWNSALTYTRALRIVDGFAQPQLVDSVIASVAGLMTRSIDFSAFARYGTGQSVTADQQRFHQSQATAQVRLALNRRISLFSQVFYSRFDSRFSFALGDLFPQALSRYGARVGINLWTPLLNARGAL